jgi:hypothetical protein
VGPNRNFKWYEEGLVDWLFLFLFVVVLICSDLSPLSLFLFSLFPPFKVREQHEEQTKMMLENNEKVMAQATKRINEVPAALKMRSDILHAEQAKATQNSKNMISKYTKLMETMKKGYELEIENLKQQHHYLIDQKATEQKKFVADFNKYYQKKTTQGTLFFLFLLFGAWWYCLYDAVHL